MKNIFSSEFHYGEEKDITWRFAYDADSGAWLVYPVEDHGIYNGVCGDLFEARRMAREIARQYVENHSEKIGAA